MSSPLGLTGVRVVRVLRQPLNITWKWNLSPPLTTLLAALVLVLMGIVYHQWQAGMLDDTKAALPIVFNMGLLPALLIVLILRSQWFRWLESRCL